MLKVGLIGAGMMGRAHAQAYRRVAGAKLVGVADSSRDSAEALAGMAGIRAYSTMEELIDAEQPDMVDLCLPTDLHKPFAVKAAALGKHVFCEKPIATTLADARTMNEACKAAGVQLMIGHALRFSPDYAMARNMIEEGRIGRVGTVRLIRESAMPEWAGWFADPGRSGGVLLDLAVHDIDWLRWTFGEAARVYGKEVEAEAGRGGHAFVSLRMRSGVIAHITGSWALPEGFRSFMEAAGTAGVIALDSDETAAIRTAVRRDGGVETAVAAPLRQDPYAAELQHFVDCIARGTTPLTNGDEAIRTLAVALAAIESARTGKVVHLEEENPS